MSSLSQDPAAVQIHLAREDDTYFAVSFTYDKGTVEVMKQIPSRFRSYDQPRKTWLFEYGIYEELMDLLKNAGFPGMERNTVWGLYDYQSMHAGVSRSLGTGRCKTVDA